LIKELSLSRERLLVWPDRKLAGFAYGVLTPLLIVVFFAIYGGADLVTGLHDYRVRLHMDWEVQLPLVPSMIVFYASLYPACVLLPLMIRTRRELRAAAWTLITVTAAGGVVFLVCPGQEAWVAPTDAELGPWRMLYRLVDTINLRHNYCPSLHVAWAVVIAEMACRRGAVPARILARCWVGGIAVSTMLTHQHYLVDVVMGFAVGLVGTRRVFPWLLRTAEHLSTSTRKRLRRHGYAWWRLSLWSGIHFGMWWRVLTNNRFRVSLTRIPQALLITLLSLMNSVLRLCRRQRRVRLRRQPGRVAPLLIIGHWRAGTTHLHELLSVDSQFSYPTLSMAFMPHYPPWFCRMLQPLLRIAGHGVRPMDNIVISESSPQEDEFSLLLQGSPSPYEFLMFPRERRHQDRLVVSGYSDRELEERKRVIVDHVDRISREAPGDRVLLKSPIYTGQLELLLELFPRAQFIHLVRNPYQLFPSAVWMMQALQYTQGFQIPNEEPVDEFVIENLRILYEAFDRHSPAIPAERLINVRYEDVVQSPIETVAKIYRQLELGPFEEMRPGLEQLLARQGNYITNAHVIDDAQCVQIESEWGFYFQRYQYVLGERPER